jgi:hypothetical protein
MKYNFLNNEDEVLFVYQTKGLKTLFFKLWIQSVIQTVLTYSFFFFMDCKSKMMILPLN